MDFQFNDDQQAFADSAQSVFADFCSDEALRAHDLSTEPYMQALWAQCVANGLHSIVLDEAVGGLGLGITELVAVLEQQGRALGQVPLAEHQLAAAVIGRFAPGFADEHTMAQLASGEALATLSLHGLDAPQGLSLAARIDGDALVLDGVAQAVAFAAQARWVVLPVRLNGGHQDDHQNGPTRLVIVPSDAPGLRLDEGRSQHHQACATLHCSAVRIGRDALMEPAALAWLEPRWCAALAALQVGVSTGQLERTVEYVSQRQQFGRVIGTFQLVAGQMADAKIALEALRSALALLVYRLDAGLGAESQALTARILAAQAAHLIGHKAQHVHGGMGVDITYPIHRYLFWSRSLSAQAGGAQAGLARLGDWLAGHDQLGWMYDLPEDLGEPGERSEWSERSEQTTIRSASHAV